MSIVYNIEDFVIKQMFNPYETLLISEDLPEYEQRKIKVVKELKKNPEIIIDVLQNNSKARYCIFLRLSNLDFKFYKWLKCPVIDYVEAGIIAFRHKKEQ